MMRCKKRFLVPLLIFAEIFLCFTLAFTAGAANDEDMLPPNIKAEAAVLMNLETGEIVFDKNMDRQMYPGSTVKIMTGILAVEHFADYETQVIAAEEAVKNAVGNSINAVAGEIFTADDLIYSLLMYNANDAANILACEVGGSIDGFIIKMNEKAIELGCTNTHFSNASGLHMNDMVTTAEDTAKIAAYAASINKIMEVTSASAYEIKPTNKSVAKRTINNRNHLVSKANTPYYFYDYARGINSGSTSEAGYCLVTTAEQKNMKYLAVILKSTSTMIPNTVTEVVDSYSDAKSLFEWVFSLYAYQKVINARKLDREVAVDLSAQTDFVGLVPAEDLEFMLPVNVDLEKDIEKNFKIFEDKLVGDRLVAPITKGEELGELIVSYNGKVLGSVKLLANATVERSNILYVLDYIKGIVARKWFKAGVATFIIFFTLYIVYSVITANKKAKRRFR